MAILKIYNDIQTENEKNVARFWGDAEGVCFKDIDEFCESIAANDNTIDIRLHCDGGSVQEGWAIYDRLRATGKTITATVEGKAASMATIILLAAPKESRRAYENAQLLVHNPWVCPWALGDSVNADDLQRYADDLRREQTRMLDLYVERCECDRAEMQALMNEDKFIDVSRAKELGLISHVIPPASAKHNAAAHPTNNKFNNQNQKSKMAKEQKKVEVGQSWLDRLLAKAGFAGKRIEEVAFGMDLNTADGGTLTVEREEGEPQVGDKATPDGEHVMPDGSTIVVADGVITEIKPADGGTGDEGGDGKKGEQDDGSGDETVEQLKQRIEELEEENKQLKEQLTDAQKNAKTKEDLRILNAVTMAGGEKALAKLSSNYKPQSRKTDGSNASRGAEGKTSAMREEIEARRNGTYKKENKNNK